MGKHRTSETKEKIRIALLGKPKTSEHREKLRLANLGKRFDEKHHMWRGDDVGYDALHDYVKRHMSKPECCQKCGLNRKLQLSNKTGIYNREFSNWWYLCVRCHTHFDGRLPNLIPGGIEHRFKQIDMSERICSECGSDKTRPRRDRNDRPDWHCRNGEWICARCNDRYKRQKKKIK